ncbi:MAG: nitroreductase [Flavobacteriales bacterium]|jgi:nitroreductase
MEVAMKYNLSEISELIRDRRTITPENYSNRVVHDEIIKNVLNSGIWAPSHGMTQPWFFKVFKGDARLRMSDFMSSLYRDLTPVDKYLQSKFDKIKSRPELSSVVIAICMRRDGNRKIEEIEEIEAVACAVQNVMLHSVGYGIGTFWSTPKLCYTDQMKEFLNLGAEDKCLGLLYMGYPESDWPKSHRKPLEYVSEWITE